MIDHGPITDHVTIDFCEDWTQERSWGSEILLVQTPFYTLKALHMKMGTRGGLQRHSVKDESFTVAKGICEIEYDPGDGQLHRSILREGDTVHIPPGAVHRTTALSDCVLYEASTPVFGDRENVSHLYGEESDSQLPDEGPRSEA